MTRAEALILDGDLAGLRGGITVMCDQARSLAGQARAAQLAPEIAARLANLSHQLDDSLGQLDKARAVIAERHLTEESRVTELRR